VQQPEKNKPAIIQGIENIDRCGESGEERWEEIKVEVGAASSPVRELA
jgi:hypothetical protein